MCELDGVEVGADVVSLLDLIWIGCRRSSYPPFLAWIEVDGKRVNHYKSVNDGKVFSAFVESVAGSSWALCYKPLAESPKYDFTVEGWVDGGRWAQPHNIIWNVGGLLIAMLIRFEFKSWEGAYAALKTPPAAPARVRKFATTKVSEVSKSLVTACVSAKLIASVAHRRKNAT